MTAEQVWQEIEKTYQHVSDLLESLDPTERAKLCGKFVAFHTSEVSNWWKSVLCDIKPDDLPDFLMKNVFAPMGMQIADATFHGIKNMVTKVEARVKDHFTPKPRNETRDDEIVRLRDVEKKTFGAIGHELTKIDKTWVGKNGKALRRDAVEKAYNRRKKTLKTP